MIPGSADTASGRGVRLILVARSDVYLTAKEPQQDHGPAPRANGREKGERVATKKGDPLTPKL